MINTPQTFNQALKFNLNWTQSVIISLTEKMENRPTILVTNDDGIDAPGLQALVRVLVSTQRYNVQVCAPDSCVYYYYYYYYYFLFLCAFVFVYVYLRLFGYCIQFILSEQFD